MRIWLAIAFRRRSNRGSTLYLKWDLPLSFFALFKFVYFRPSLFIFSSNSHPSGLSLVHWHDGNQWVSKVQSNSPRVNQQFKSLAKSSQLELEKKNFKFSRVKQSSLKVMMEFIYYSFWLKENTQVQCTKLSNFFVYLRNIVPLVSIMKHFTVENSFYRIT